MFVFAYCISLSTLVCTTWRWPPWCAETCSSPNYTLTVLLLTVRSMNINPYPTAFPYGNTVG